MIKEFTVIDNNTGKQADQEEIALNEEWADGLMYCDMDGFAIMENGSLILIDECGKYAYCPEGRFTVVENAPLRKTNICKVCEKITNENKDIFWVFARTHQPEDKEEFRRVPARFCPACGRKIEKEDFQIRYLGKLVKSEPSVKGEVSNEN